MENVKCIDCVEYMRSCEAEVFDLTIADPPYFNICGDFDDTKRSILIQGGCQIAKTLLCVMLFQLIPVLENAYYDRAYRMAFWQYYIPVAIV